MTSVPALYSLAGKRVWIAGHRGMVGSALRRRLAGSGCTLLTVGREDLDLTDQAAVARWMAAERPQVVVMAAALVGGIVANASRPAEFIRVNLAIAANTIDAAHATGVEKLLFLGSSCTYPRLAAQPIAEDALMTGPIEPTSEAYATAKIAGMRMAQAYRRQYGDDFIVAIPTGVYGPGDTFDPEAGHVLPALLRRFHEAKRDGLEAVTLWGSGAPLREFLHVDDLADALVFLLEHYSDAAPINVGSGVEVSIRELAERIARLVGFEGEIRFDPAKPDGAPRKLLDSARLAALGWRAGRGLDQGLAETYAAWRAATGSAG